MHRLTHKFIKRRVSGNPYRNLSKTIQLPQGTGRVAAVTPWRLG